MKTPFIAKLITPRGEITPVVPKNGTDFELDELKTFVGGYIEIIHPKSNDGAIMVINEEGKLKGLAFNPIATSIWKHDDIVGTALLCHTSQVK